jgi:hypothetical protein
MVLWAFYRVYNPLLSLKTNPVDAMGAVVAHAVQ